MQEVMRYNKRNNRVTKRQNIEDMLGFPDYKMILFCMLSFSYSTVPYLPNEIVLASEQVIIHIQHCYPSMISIVSLGQIVLTPQSNVVLHCIHRLTDGKIYENNISFSGKMQDYHGASKFHIF